MLTTPGKTITLKIQPSDTIDDVREQVDKKDLNNKRVNKQKTINTNKMNFRKLFYVTSNLPGILRWLQHRLLSYKGRQGIDRWHPQGQQNRQS